MIINGASRCNGGWFTKHLTNDAQNERVTLVEIRGLAAEDVGGAFKEMEAVASGTRCKNYFYHANINPRDDESLTADQWEQSADALETHLGLAGQPRFVVEHEKGGRTHRHVIWSRIDVDRMRAISDSKDREKCHMTSRQLEQAFDLARGTSRFDKDRDRNGPHPERGPASWEMFRGQKSGIDPRDVKAEVTALWHSADSGKSFAAALEERGYILAKGDRRDFCLIDRAGHEHSLARRLQGVKAAEVRARMADVDRVALPSIAEACLLQKERMAEREAARAAWAQRAEEAERAKAQRTARIAAMLYDEADMVSMQRDALRHIRMLQTQAEGHTSTPTGPPRSGPSDPLTVVAQRFLDAKTPSPSASAAVPESRGAALRARFAREQAERDRTAALDRLAAAKKAGAPLNPQDLGGLHTADLQTIVKQGEAGVQALLHLHAQVRQHQRDTDRER